MQTGRGPGGEYVQYDNSVQVGGDRNWRNNNPGNIEAGQFADSHGAIGSDGRFAIFPNHATGMQALRSLLTSVGYARLTISEAMERYAPPSENDTGGYTSFVVRRVGVDASTLMADLTPEQVSAFGNAIEIFEGGKAGTIYQIGDEKSPSWVRSLFDESQSDISSV